MYSYRIDGEHPDMVTLVGGFLILYLKMFFFQTKSSKNSAAYCAHNILDHCLSTPAFLFSPSFLFYQKPSSNKISGSKAAFLPYFVTL